MQNQSMQYSELANSLIMEYQKLSGQRAIWEGHWEEIAQRVVPTHSNMFRGHQTPNTQGQKKTQFLFDSTASVALGRFGAIMDSMLTPSNQKWHRILPVDPGAMKNRQIKLWFEQLNDVLFRYRYAPRANFTSQNQQNFLSLGAYGNGGMFIDRLDGQPGIRYRNCFLGELHFAENHQGRVDKVYRHFTMTARQISQKFPRTIPDQIREQLKTDPEKEFLMIHAVIPREDVQYGRKDFKGMPVASYYVCKETQSILSESGYRTMPYAISRYNQFAPESYGRGPCTDILPSIKTLNEQKKTQLKQGHRVVDPVLLAHDDGLVDSFSLRPGAINYGGVSADGRPLVHALPTGNLSVGKELMDDERTLINDNFLVSLFQILVETPTMSATEILERAREKNILIAPTVGRQTSEYLGPMVEREVEVLQMQGLLPPMPLVLQRQAIEWHLMYDSPMSRSMRAEEASGLMRTVESVLNVVQITQDKAPLDFFHWDTIVPELAEIQGIPQRWILDVPAVMQIRAQRAQEAQSQQAIQAAPAASSMIKSIGAVQKQA